MSINMDIIQLMDNIVKEESKIEEYEEIIKEKNRKIKSYKLLLWDKCSHMWIWDPHVSFDDGCKYCCSICTLWRDRSLYK